MKIFLPFCLLLVLCMPLTLTAQQAPRLNFGVKGGFGSTLYSLQELSISGHPIDAFDTHSLVSWQGAAVLRLNIKRHYLQTECGLSNNKYTVQFPSEMVYDYARKSDISTISTHLQCLEVPLLYGYQLRQEGDYSMSVFTGPKLCCILPDRSQYTFTNFTHKSIAETVRPINTALVAGFCINIRHLFFDLCAEAGLSNVSKQFNTISQSGVASNTDIVYNRHRNSINFSVGVLF